MKTVWVSRDFNVSADRLFSHILSYDAFAEVEPEGLDLSRFAGRSLRVGDHLETPFPPLPMFDWKIDVVRVDPTERIVKTEESGAFIKRWAHTLSVTPLTPESCRYSDHVVIEAGMLSRLVARSAKKMYEARQSRRAEILAND